MAAKKSSKTAKKARKTTVAKTARKAGTKTKAKAAKAGKTAARKSAAAKSAPARKAAAKKAAPAKTKRATQARSKPAAAAKPRTAAKKPAPKRKSPTPKHETLRPAPVAEPLQTEADETEFEYDTNLLSGPRNVQPYVTRRGEQYMNKEQLEHFRQILFTWKRDLMEEVDRTVLHMKDEAANFPDPNDRATQESEFSLELRTRDRERKLIRKIDEALKRIEDGSYGYCNETGEEIGIKRLEARPVATLCVEAQERRERREKQYGDRDDRYR
jgi:DnaK suppressor protein